MRKLTDHIVEGDSVNHQERLRRAQQMQEMIRNESFGGDAYSAQYWQAMQALQADAMQWVGEPPAPRVIENMAAPEKVAVQVSAEVTPEYIALAAKIGYSTPEVQQQRLLSFLLENGYSTYEHARVVVYMDNLVAKENVKRREAKGFGISMLLWYWRPLRKQDPTLASRRDMDSSPYNKPIPMPVLETIANIADKLPEAQFYVTDYAEVKPDPFLGILLPGMPTDQIVTIERWDEPAFR